MPRLSSALLFAVAALPLALAALGAQQPVPPVPPGPPQVVTTGTGEVRVTPDRATVYIAVETRGETAAEAGAENARRQRATLDALRAAGLTAEQLSTVNYSVSPNYEHDPQGRTPPRLAGYVARNTIRADVRALDALGKVIDAALGAGANRIDGVQFYSSTADDARQRAMASAVVNARAQAEAMAKAAGGTLGRLLELNSQSYNEPRPMADYAQFRVQAAAAAPAPETPINPGEFTLSATVLARWEFLGTSAR